MFQCQMLQCDATQDTTILATYIVERKYEVQDKITKKNDFVNVFLSQNFLTFHSYD